MSIELHVTEPERPARKVKLEPGVDFTIGRHNTNRVVLGAAGVSGQHCLLRWHNGAWHLIDQGSTNGTFLENHRVSAPTPVTAGQDIHVGVAVLELRAVVASGATGGATGGATAGGPGARPQGSPSLIGSTAGPLISNTASASSTAFVQRVERYWDEWDGKGRPDRLLLRDKDLDRAEEELSSHNASADLLAYVAASRAAATRRKRQRLAIIAGAGLLVVAGIVGTILATSGDDEDLPPSTSQAAPETPGRERVAVDADAATNAEGGPVDLTRAQREWLEHEVIPEETIQDVAVRYGIAPGMVARWNSLAVDDALTAGTTIRVKPKLYPLPQQRVRYEVEDGEDWALVSRRFQVPVGKLRAYTPEKQGALAKGDSLTVWIDPKPLERGNVNMQIPEFEVRPGAVSVGKPADGGKLLNGIQMPPSELYKRRAPYIMWGSTHLIRNLMGGIARFREVYNFEGIVVVADISRRDGGSFPPHKSHQSGRDVDIWLPTLKGVYKEKYLGDGRTRERRPEPEEADWFAVWGLVESLIATGEVRYIFLSYHLQENVYEAAKLMGVPDEDLRKAMQWPRGRRAAGVLSHSDGHTHHIHVRFKCGPDDTQCRG